MVETGLGLAGSVVAVTGGASGIGKACVLALASEGASVVSVDLDVAAAAALVREATGCVGTVTSLVGDACSADDLRRVVDAADSLGGLDAAVVNAGAPNSLVRTAAVSGPTVMQDAGLWSRVVDATMLPVFIGCSLFAQDMIDNGRPGALVTLGASLGLRAAPHNAAFAAAKAGVHQLTQTLAYELAGYRIRVNCIAPLFVDTPGARAAVHKSRRAISEATIPLGRLAQPEDIAGAVLFLISRLSSFVTGQTLLVDGGLFTTTLRPPRGWAPSDSFLEALRDLRSGVSTGA